MNKKFLKGLLFAFFATLDRTELTKQTKQVISKRILESDIHFRLATHVPFRKKLKLT